MRRMYATLLFAVVLCATPFASRAQQCVPVDHAADDFVELNRFWKTSFQLCQLPPGTNNALADRARGTVWADQTWLDGVATLYGNWAATGVLAHEWGHMVQGNYHGTAAELQADCLAGVFMRGVGLPWQTVEQFAQSNFFAGDMMMSFNGHGTGPQRVFAARRGYYGYAGQAGATLGQLCPLSAF